MAIFERGRQYSCESFSDAIQSYTKALQFEQTKPVLYSNRAIAELKLKKYANARQDVDYAIEYAKLNNNHVENSDMAKYQRLLSEAFMRMDRLSEALEACEKGLELDPKDGVLFERSTHIQTLIVKEKIFYSTPNVDYISYSIPKIRKDIDNLQRCVPKLIERINRGQNY
jgi:tetratricopeptide (TPR) repeat protein